MSGVSDHKPAGWFLICLMVCLGAAGVTPARAQQQAPNVTVKKVPVQQTSEIAGSKLFHSYCAVCHGEDAKGNGPAVPALRVAPPDLTLLARSNGGEFPSAHVTELLKSGVELRAHGSKEMPIWGPVLRAIGADRSDSMAMLRIKNLTDYLKSIQAK